MKIAVTAAGPQLESPVEPRFGRCPYFVIVETDTLNYEAVENPNVALGGGAGIQSAQLLANHQVQAVLTGNCGPNAFSTLGAAEIQVIVAVSGTVGQAVEQFKNGAYAGATAPNVASHFGMTATNPTPEPTASTMPPADKPGTAGMGMGMGGGPGMGRGMGQGGGRGMGGGMGMGGGPGMGRGMGQGAGRGMGMAANPMTPPSPPVPPGVPMGQPTTSPQPAPQDLDALKAQAQHMSDQLDAINARINEVQHASPTARLVASVDADACTACTLCHNVCPADAISVTDVARINEENCTACGQCVATCPQNAITLKKAS